MTHNVPSDWLQEYPYEDTISLLSGLARLHAEHVKSKIGLSIIEMLDRADYAALCNLELDYKSGDHSPADFQHLRQALAFFQKLEPLRLGIDKESVAFSKFKTSETLCRGTNWLWGSGKLAAFSTASESSVFHRAQHKISSILGPVPSLDSLDFGFGPGANTTVKSRTANPRSKLGAQLACSAELASSVETLLAEAPQWCSVHDQKDNMDDIFGYCNMTDDYYRFMVEIHPGRLQFVPKNAKTYRSIVIEPILNSFAQKGIGTYLKKRLRKSGVNLKDQTRNQLLARVGSLTNSLATLDLSMASDTVSKEVVASLLPLDWYSFLSRFRTGTVEYHGELFQLEKFSSMGNGFTFELESLLFYALSAAVCDHLGLSSMDVSVYGDDIIVPSGATQLLLRVLDLAGFSVNEQKSFVDGPFRESCGSDWYKGFDIRPYYQDHLVTAETLFSLHNFYARRFEFSMCAEVVEWIHPSLRIYGPDGFGDGHLIGSYPERRSPKIEERGWDGVLFDTFTRRAKVDTRKFLPGDTCLPGYSIYVSGTPSVSEGYSSAKRTMDQKSKDISDWSIVPYRCDQDLFNFVGTPEEHFVPKDHRVIRGSRGYKRITMYTLSRGIFF